ncbi:MAG: hypothetical protein Q9228_007113 [Teloschistes exilis]
MSGQRHRASWDRIAPFGPFIEIGKVDIYSAAVSVHVSVPKERHVCLARFGAHRPHQHQAAQEDSGKGHAAGPVKEDHRMSSSARLLLRWDRGVVQADAEWETDVVKATPNLKPTYRFDAGATYLISGCLGGLGGRSMARLMVSRGARKPHLTFTFRTQERCFQAPCDGAGVAGSPRAHPKLRRE